MTVAADGLRRRQVLAQLGLVSYRQRGRQVAGAGETMLEVSAPDSLVAPVAAPAAGVWAGVLAWLGLEPGQVRWRPAGGIALPAVADWSGPDGKRGLWLALKGWRGPVG